MANYASASPSPTASIHEPPTLDRLVVYFVAAKRSLSSTSQVWRANKIVQEARRLVEEHAVLKAKNTFVRHGVEEQVNVLHSVGTGLETVAREAQVEFQAVVRSLDVANDRLQVTLASLRKTTISRELTSPNRNVDEEVDESQELYEGKSEEGSQLKSLHDFIDEATHTGLLDSLRNTIDSYNNAQGSLQTTRVTLEDSLRTLHSELKSIDELHEKDTAAYATTNLSLSSDSASIPSTFHALTTHASELASLLQSLISHYDLCITALKHTEGGSEAARAATSSTSNLISDPHTSTADESPEASLYRNKARAPISASERDQMIHVLVTDAAEVDDVVLEIRDRSASMEFLLSSLQARAQRLRSVHKKLQSVLSSLSTLGTELPSHVAAARSFRQTWSDLRSSIEDQTAELVSLTGFYDSFIASYASLLREVERRRMIDAKMKKIAERARREMQALYAEDVDMREQFLKSVGEYLPRDIWSGLVERPVRWEVKEVEEDVVEGEGEEEVVQEQYP